MKQYTFNQAAGLVLLAFGLVHLFRIVQGWEVVIGGLVVPVWFSWIVVLLTVFLAFHAITFVNRRR